MQKQKKKKKQNIISDFIYATKSLSDKCFG